VNSIAKKDAIGVDSIALKNVELNLQQTVREYFASRARQHVYDSYVGVPMLKMPESLRIYDHLLWQSNANVVIEIGALYGGSTLWFRDRLEAFSRYRSTQDIKVIAVDKNLALARATLEKCDSTSIVLLEHDVVAGGLRELIEPHLPRGPRPLIIEDSAHTFETTLAALQQAAPLVTQGGFFVVEDCYLDGPLRSSFTDGELEYDGIKFGGMTRAMESWLSTSKGKTFEVRRDLEYYGVSGMPNGILQKVR
jgi:cephalosporin hydroxylase